MTFLFTNETFVFPFVRKISGGELSLSEKSEFFRTPFPVWKWESGFLEMRLFLWCTITLFWIVAFNSQVRHFASKSERCFVFDKFLEEFLCSHNLSRHPKAIWNNFPNDCVNVELVSS